jgi:hypothetical protein
VKESAEKSCVGANNRKAYSERIGTFAAPSYKLDTGDWRGVSVLPRTVGSSTVRMPTNAPAFLARRATQSLPTL